MWCWTWFLSPLCADGLRCDRLHQKLCDTPAIGANKRVKNANAQNIKTKLQTITRNFVTLWYEERIISFCKYKVSLKRKAPERKEPQQRTSYQTFLLYVNVLFELSQLSYIVIRRFLMTQISLSIDDSGFLEMNRIPLKSSPEAIIK